MYKRQPTHRAHPIYTPAHARTQVAWIATARSHTHKRTSVIHTHPHPKTQSFYIPRSNPDGVAVTVHCIDKSTGACSHPPNPKIRKRFYIPKAALRVAYATNTYTHISVYTRPAPNVSQYAVRSLEIRPFDGQEWEAYFNKSGIQQLSKEGASTGENK